VFSSLHPFFFSFYCLKAVHEIVTVDFFISRRTLVGSGQHEGHPNQSLSANRLLLFQLLLLYQKPHSFRLLHSNCLRSPCLLPPRSAPVTDEGNPLLLVYLFLFFSSCFSLVCGLFFLLHICVISLLLCVLCPSSSFGPKNPFQQFRHIPPPSCYNLYLFLVCSF
jgi:hypothetical protein